MAYEAEMITYSQKIFYYLLCHGALSDLDAGVNDLYRAYVEHEEVMNLVKNQAEIADCKIERYGTTIYLMPDIDNKYLGFTKADLKKELCKPNATDRDYYLAQFVILTLLAEFYDGQGSTSKSREFLKLGELQNIVVDAEDANGGTVVISDVDGGGFQDLPILGPGQIGQVIVELFGIPSQGFQNYVRGPVPRLASGDVSVFNGNDGPFRVIGGKIVNHHLAVGAELTGDPLCQRQEKLQRRCIRHVNALLFRSAAETPQKERGKLWNTRSDPLPLTDLL